MKKRVYVLSIGIALIVIAVMVLFLLYTTDKDFSYPSEDVFSLDVKYNAEGIAAGEELTLEAELKNLSGKDYVMHHYAPEMITYKINGEYELIYDMGMYETFKKNTSQERIIHITPETGGVYEIMIMAKFDIMPSMDSAESKEYVISKTISIDVPSGE